MITTRDLICTAGDTHEIAKQAEVELALLMSIEKAFHIALDWKTNGRGNTRKLSTLRFVTRTFDHHLARVRVLSEYGGYMRLVTDSKPELARAVQSLKDVRDSLQAHLEQIMIRLEHISPGETAVFDGLCDELARYLTDLDAHVQNEMELLQRCFAQEEGGTG